jgi:DNA-binding transcriptional LysR family regulator
MRWELRHLHVVVVVADAGSVSRAATRLGQSQPALTAQLQRIEAAVGGRLFDRSRDGVRLTPLGEFVLPRARALLSAADELQIGATRCVVPGSRPSQVRLGGVPGAALFGMVQWLHRTLPETTTRVHTEYSPRLVVDLLSRGRFDAAALIDYPGYESPPPDGVAVAVVSREPIFVALAARHRLARLPEIELAALADEDWMTSPPDGAGWPEAFVEACQRVGYAPRQTHCLTANRTLQAMLAAGYGVSACQATFAAGAGVVVRPLAGAPLWLRHVVAWHRDGALAAFHAEVLTAVRAAYQADAARFPAYRKWRARHPDSIQHDTGPGRR